MKLFKYFNKIKSLESLLLVSSIGGSVASIISQQVAFAAITSIPLSLAVGFNSYNRKRLDEVNQRHQVSLIQLEQKFSTNREFFDQVLCSLPTYSALTDIENRLEARNTAFTEKINTLSEQQASTHLKLQQIDNWRNEATDVQQQLSILESLLQSYSSAHLNGNLQQAIVTVEEKFENLEWQFNNLPICNLQQQLLQVQQLFDKLQESSTESTQIYKCLLGEIQSVSKQVQTLTSKTEELSLTDRELQMLLAHIQERIIDCEAGLNTSQSVKFYSVEQVQQLFNDLQISIVNKSTDINQVFTQEVHSLRQEIQALSNSISEKIESLQVESQNHQCYLEKTKDKIHADIYVLTDWYDELERKLDKIIETQKVHQNNTLINQQAKVISLNQLKNTCYHCTKDYMNKPIEGGEFLNYKFCSYNCKHEYERLNGLL